MGHWGRSDSIYERGGSYQVTGIALGGAWRRLGSVPGISPVMTSIALAIRAIATPQIIVRPTVLVTPSIGRVPSAATSSSATSLSATIVAQLWGGILAVFRGCGAGIC